ncbi:MAG TPA: conjugal transfer protein TrbE [Noviherbaspirillum sp.]|nr:conjugal transfer protein TrbE [Noviherbaspirillum sp.]
MPYTVPLDPYTCATRDWDVTRTFQMAGVPFETQATSVLNDLARQFITTLNGLATQSTRVALWSHLIRTKIRYDLAGIEYDNYFSNELNRQYAAKLEKNDFYVNELYLSPVYRPAGTAAERYAQRLSRDKDQKRIVHSDALQSIEEITSQLMVSLRRYHPSLLGTTETDDGALLAAYTELYARILNGGESHPVAVNRYPIAYAIQRSEIHFDGDTVIIERPDCTRYAGILTLKAPYSIEQVKPHLLHGLLKLKAEFVLSQSLTFLSAAKAERFIDVQLEQIRSTTGNTKQIKELENAKTGLQNGDFSMGEHEFILCLYGDTVAELNSAIAEAKAVFDQKSLEVIREARGGLIDTYYSMLPANFRMKRVRAQPISIENFVSMFPMHNYVTGNPSGSQWGMPIAMLKTAGDSPYFYNYHVSRQALRDQGVQLEYTEEEDEDEEAEAEAIDASDVPLPAGAEGVLSAQSDAAPELPTYASDDIEKIDLHESPAESGKRRRQQRKDSGNCILIGPNGSGKTVAQCLLRALTRKKKLRGKRPYMSFTFDKDYGQEAFICALGGRYFRFIKGEFTGINLFHSLPNNKRTRSFMLDMAKWCASRDETYVPSVYDEKTLDAAIQEVYQLSRPLQRWGRILDTLDSGSPLHSAFSRWCEEENGAYAWVLDSPEDRFDFHAARDFGFDMSEFLDDDLSRTPILRSLKFKIDMEAPGSPYSLELDEAATALRDPILREDIIGKEARTIRKKDGILVLSVQDASDLTQGPLAGLLTTQFPTMLIFPNGQASREHYVDGLKLTESEFEMVKKGMSSMPGAFLLKRGIESVVVQADLSGMGDMLSILSGSSDNLPLVRGLIEAYDHDPSKWLPEFFKRRKN